MNTTTHIHRIRRRALEVHVRAAVEASAWRTRVRGWWDDALAPALGRVLDEMAPGPDIWRVGRVEVELHAGPDMPRADLEHAFAIALRERLHALRRAARPGVGPSGAGEDHASALLDPARHVRAWLDVWLRAGIFPWWAGQPTREATIEALRRMLHDEPSAALWLAELIRAKPAVATRLASQAPVAAHVRLLAATRAGAAFEEFAAWLQLWLEAEPARAAAAPGIWEATWSAWARRALFPAGWPATVARLAARIDSVGAATVRRLLLAAAETMDASAGTATAARENGTSAGKAPRRVQGASPVRGDAPGHAVDEDAAPPADDEAAATVVVENAGLVLLAPFLVGMFQALGCDHLLARVVDGDERPPIPEEAGRLVLLLHHLATGTSEAFEPQLVLPKLLCGLPIDWPVPGAIALTDLEREEAAALLGSVIDHWSALRATTPDGLRGSFLQRPGLLDRVEHGWRLRVENRGWDVLIEHVPWTFRTVKLPWMPEPLWVDWSASP